MGLKKPPMFMSDDMCIFLGSEKSCYGVNHHSDKYIGHTVTIDRIHPTGYPYAYTFREFDSGYWFSENCFEPILHPDLPEFEVNLSIEELF